MKKRIWGILLGIGVALLSAGCGGNRTRGIEQDGALEETETLEAEDTKEETKAEEGQPEDEAESSDETQEAVLLFKEKQLVYVKGNQAEIVYQAGEYEYIEAACEEAGTVYFAAAVYDENYHSSYYTVYVWEPGSEELGILVDSLDGYAVTLDGWQGKLYMQYSVFDENGDSQVYLRDYQPDGNGGYLEDSEFQELSDAIRKAGYYPGSIPGDLEKYGVVYATRQEDSQIVSFDTEGNLLSVIFEAPVTDNVNWIEGWNDQYVIYGLTESTGEDYTQTVRKEIVHNLATGEEIMLFEGLIEDEELIYILELDGEQIFYYRTDNEEYGTQKNAVYVYDIPKKTEILLYEAISKPGTKSNSYASPGVAGFQVKDGIYYYLQPEETDLVWYCGDVNAQGEQPYSLGIVEAHYDFTDYGSVAYAGKTFSRPAETGKDMEYYFYYVEWFLLDTTYDQAEKINGILKEKADKGIGYAEETAGSAEDTFAEEDEEFYSAAWSYNEDLQSVTLIGSHYLAVNYTGYEYWGGAHGYPFREQLLFDLDTGEQKTFADFYTGDEETFKKLVAEKTIETWKKNPEQFFEKDDEETFYQELYENASSDMLMEFAGEELTILYTPYEYGPYASGYIEIAIPYGELGMNMD